VACRDVSTFAPPSSLSSIAALREFRDRLLPPTLENALRTELYREIWSGIDARSITVDTLHRLPVIDKEVVRTAGARAQIRTGLVCDEVFTSGTSGVPLVTVRGDREQRYIRDFFLDLHSRVAPGPRLRGLIINNPYHGHQVAVPAPIHFHKIGIYDNGSFAHARHVLRSPHSDHGVDSHCSVMIGLERCLRAFTLDTAQHFPDGVDSHLTHIISYSQYLTPHWKKRLEQAWRCRVIDRYSLTEIFGGATQCLKCEWWHFDPFIIPEVVQSHRRQAVREGVGALLLTALYPFQEAQPVVRYDTGDLVAVTESRSCQQGVLSVRPLGRVPFGVPMPEGDEWLLTPAAIFEVMDEIPAIARIPRFRDADQVADPVGIGHPKYQVQHRIDGSKLRIMLAIEPRPRTRSADRAAMRDRIVAELSQASLELASGLASGTVELNVVFTSNIRADLIAHAV
jgi:hypothetical protein